MKTIKIKEEVQIPGTDVILEAGDRIEILKENEMDHTWKGDRSDMSLWVADDYGDHYLNPVNINITDLKKSDIFRVLDLVSDFIKKYR